MTEKTGAAMNRKITVREIAEHCGVSMATVSRAINGNSYVSPELRKKIREYLEDIGWEPRNLPGKRQNELEPEVVVIASLELLDHLESARELKLLVNELYHAGFQPVLRLGHRSESLRSCLETRPELVVLNGFSDRLYEDVKRLQEAGIRVVGLGEAHACPCPLVMSDHRSAGREAAETLRKRGARRIALFAMMGAQAHPEELEKIYSRSAKIIRGIREVFPAFDPAADAVSDCFGDLTEFKRMLASGLYDGWVLGDSRRLEEMIAQAGEFQVMESRVVLLQVHALTPVPSICLKVLAENELGRIRTLLELIQRPAGDPARSVVVPYLGTRGGRRRAKVGAGSGRGGVEF